MPNCEDVLIFIAALWCGHCDVFVVAEVALGVPLAGGVGGGLVVFGGEVRDCGFEGEEGQLALLDFLADLLKCDVRGLVAEGRWWEVVAGSGAVPRCRGGAPPGRWRAGRGVC